MGFLVLHQTPAIMIQFVAIPTLHWDLLIRVLLPQVDIKIRFSAKQGVANFAFELGRRLGVLLHHVHFERAVLRKARLAMRTLVRLLARVAELVSLQVKRVRERLAADITRERTLTCVRPEMPSEFGDFDRGIVTQGTFERFFVRVFVASMSGEFARGHKGHIASGFGTFVWLDA